MKRVPGLLLVLGGLVVAGCDQLEQLEDNKVDTGYDRASVAQFRIEQGQSLYAKNCAACHGSDAQASSDWRKRDTNGNYPPPPLDGTAHTWHHPKTALIYTIKNGTKAIGGSMPAWKDTLSDEEIESIILWLQSKWPEQIYQAWVKRDKESIKRKK